MRKNNTYEIRFAGLKEGTHKYAYTVDERLFEDHFQYNEFNKARVNIDLALIKKPNMLELFFEVDGVVNVNCDVSNEPYDQSIHGHLELVVKFGVEYEDDQEVLILPYGAQDLDVIQYVYEAVVLAVPYKKVHPKVLDGTMDSPVLRKLEELSPGQKSDQEETDPRWDKLKELLNEK